MSNPCGRRGKAGFVASTLAVPIFGGVLCCFGQVGWGIALIVWKYLFYPVYLDCIWEKIKYDYKSY